MLALVGNRTALDLFLGQGEAEKSFWMFELETYGWDQQAESPREAKKFDY